MICALDHYPVVNASFYHITFGQQVKAGSPICYRNKVHSLPESHGPLFENQLKTFLFINHA